MFHRSNLKQLSDLIHPPNLATRGGVSFWIVRQEGASKRKLPMPYSTDTELFELTARFIERTLPKPEWTHAAHFAVGLCLLENRTRDAFADMPGLIKAYNEATGVPNTDTEGYHETITFASLLAARDFRARYTPDHALHLVLADLLVSPFGRSDWLLKHWTKGVLFSPEARRIWVAPDLSPLPFAAGLVSAPAKSAQE